MSSLPVNRFFAPKKRPLVLGHRGAPHLHQENSLAGLRRALELGADGVEFDVFLTKDERVVVFHDEDLERLTGHKGRVLDRTWDELSKLRLQRRVQMGKNAQGQDVVLTFDREEPIPLLEEVLHELKGRAAIDVELKPGWPKHAERTVGAHTAEIIRKLGMEDQVVVTSFDFYKLKAAEATFPHLHTGFAYDDNTLDGLEKFLRQLPEFPSQLAKLAGNQNVETLLNWLIEHNAVGRFIGSTAVNIEQTLIDEDTISRFQKLRMAVGTYTLFPLDTNAVKHPRSEEEEATSARSLARLGVDWFETDDPEKLLQALSSG